MVYFEFIILINFSSFIIVITTINMDVQIIINFIFAHIFN